MVMIMIMIWTRGVTSLPPPTLQHYPPAITVTTVTFGWYHIIPTHKPGIQSSLSNLSHLSVCLSVRLSICLSRCVQAGLAWLEMFEVIPLLLLLSWSYKSLSFCLPLCEESPCNCWSWVPGRQAGKLKQEEQGQTRVVTGQWDWSLGLSLPAFTLPFRPSFPPYFYFPFISWVCAFVFLSFFLCPSICMAPCPHSPNRIVGTNKRCYLS